MCDPPSWYGSAMNATSGLMVAAALYAVPLVFLYVGHALLTKNRMRTIVPNAPDSKKTETAAPRRSTWVIREWTPYLTGKCKTCFKKANFLLYSNTEGNCTTLAICLLIYLFTSLGPSNKSTCPIEKSVLELVGSLLHFLIALLRIR